MLALWLWRQFYPLLSLFGLNNPGIQIGVSEYLARRYSHGVVRIINRTSSSIETIHFCVDKPRFLYKPSVFIRYEILRQCAAMGFEVHSVIITAHDQKLLVSKGLLNKEYRRKLYFGALVN